VNVYPCSKARHCCWFSALKAAGVPFRASWLTWEFNLTDGEPTEAEWAEHSATCLREAREADVVLMVGLDGENQFGALLECGAALAAGKRVFLVSPHPWHFLRHHPRCRSFDSIADAVHAIMAGASRFERMVA
jgi:hypothetical protein